MAKLSNKNSGGSFHDTTIRTTVNKLEQAIGQAQCIYNSGDDKTNYDWNCETEDGDVFSIYDWKEYRPIGPNEMIEFHIGGETKSITEQAKRELLAILNN
jgi:hypothetical protein